MCGVGQGVNLGGGQGPINNHPIAFKKSKQKMPYQQQMFIIPGEN
jgi:hypothetical protein